MLRFSSLMLDGLSANVKQTIVNFSVFCILLVCIYKHVQTSKIFGRQWLFFQILCISDVCLLGDFPIKLAQNISLTGTVLYPYRDIWEKKPLLIHRHNLHHNDSWFSTEELDRILHEVQVMPLWFSIKISNGNAFS